MPENQVWKTDRELIDAVVRGEPGAADRFVDQFSAFVWAILARDLGVRRDRAEDLYQELFERLLEKDYRRLIMWRGEGSFVSYLGPIVRRLAYDRLRGRKEVQEGEEGLEIADPDWGPEDLAAVQEEQVILMEAMSALKPRDRALIARRHLEELSYKEIAREMGLTVNHVGVALGRAEKRLVRKLRKMGVSGPRVGKKPVIRAGGMPSRL